MEKVMNILKPKPNSQEILRVWRRKLRQQSQNIDRQIRDIQREEKKVQKAIKEAAKRNDIGSAKLCFTWGENSSDWLTNQVRREGKESISRTIGHLSKSAEVMKLVNNLMKTPEMAVAMQEFSKEMTKAGVIEEIVNDAVDSALDSEDIEDEIEEEVDKVLTAIAGETATQLPEAVRKQKVKQPAQRVVAADEEKAIAEGVNDEEEMEEIRARLAKVRS
ncbi:hypothetical protein TSUD_98010 [Trifolium subterraneum]|uniref:Uncharacterized protein n=1 Tax=Trifolium subterraneum TaxID=3900 RepID=A0A2Z6LUA4_TRISU|nr:hypothetical protein TSUD_98010 [Trifolium subterraneum]